MRDMGNVTESGPACEAGNGANSQDRANVLALGETVSTDPSDDRLRIARAAYTIETELIPRLLLASRSTGVLARRSIERVAPKLPEDLSSEVEAFTKVVLREETPAAYAHIAELRARGLTIEAIFLDILAPTARRLGDMWVADRCSFTDVTLGLCRLQQVLRLWSDAFEHEIEQDDVGCSVLLSPIPGEQHTFGILMLEEFYRRAGWDTVLMMPSEGLEICDVLHRDWFSAAGISISCDFSSDHLKSLIGEMRASSRNPTLAVLVGGRAFQADRELVTAVGADATAVDGREAIVQTHRLVGEMRRASDRRSG
jgi:methanogenic corrinoid protein MtbC1